MGSFFEKMKQSKGTWLLVIGILEVVYLYRTAKLFRAYPA